MERDGWMDGWMDGKVDEWKNRKTEVGKMMYCALIIM